MKNKLTHRPLAKVIAIIIFCLLIPVGLGCVAGFGYCWDQGWYQGEAVDYSGSYICVDRTVNNIWDLYYSLQPDGSPANGYQQPAGFAYIITDEYGNTLGDTTVPGSRLVVEGWKAYVAEDSRSYLGEKEQPYDDERPAVDQDSAEGVQVTEPVEHLYYVSGYVNMPITHDSVYYTSYRAFLIISSLRDWYVPAGIAAGVLALACFIFLMFAAGHKPDSEDISLTGFHRIPLDLLAGLSAIILLLLYNWGFYGYWSSYWRVLMPGMALFWAALLGLGLAMTVAARLKAGGWWRNTLIYLIFVRGGGWLLKALPLAWKLVLGYLAFMGLNLLMVLVSGKIFPLTVLALDLAMLVLLLCVALQMRRLQKGGQALAAGNLAHKVDADKLWLELKQHGQDMNSVSQGMALAVEERLKSERFKTELITNVSHDLKTPLTAIVSYVDLLKKRPIEDPEAREYIEVLERQSARLKKLTEDLVDASKASSGVIAVNKDRLNIGELLSQCAGEFDQRFAAAQLTPMLNLPEQDVLALADGRLLWRVFDNLFQNVCKYSEPGTRVYISLAGFTRVALVTVKNISAEALNIPAEELMERFVRGDTSRHSDGSGLGLSIARSLAELMGGSLALDIDGDLFKATVTLPLAGEEEGQ